MPEAIFSRVLAVAALLQSGDALRTCGPLTTRRAALAGLLTIPSAACAYPTSNPLDFEGEVTYKNRNYGDTAAPAKSKVTSCPEGSRKTPDGFGGFKCADTVKTVPQRVFSGIVDDAPPPPPPPPPPPKAAVGESTRSSTPSSSAPALTVDQLIANSISQKETLLGRGLTDAEKADMAAKVKKLMGE